MVNVSRRPFTNWRLNFMWLPRCEIREKPKSLNILRTSSPDKDRSFGIRQRLQVPLLPGSSDEQRNLIRPDPLLRGAAQWLP